MNVKKFRFLLLVIAVACSQIVSAQDDLLSLVDSKKDQKKEFVTGAFKSSRVINGHSMDFIGKGQMDVRILHRFGLVYSGFSNLFGLDQANMRFGFDFGISKNLTIGMGRSNVGKEWDGFIKYRPLHQSTGGRGSSPISIVLITGSTISTTPWADPKRKNFFTSRMAFYNEIIIGRKFNKNFSMQLAPTHVHLNLVDYNIYSNDIFAMGVGARYKLSKRTAFVVDYHYILRMSTEGEDGSASVANAQFKNMKNPLSIGFDVETGGHVFQLHFSNATGMNEKAFITNTTNSWEKTEIRFGFNLSRMFTVGKK